MDRKLSKNRHSKFHSTSGLQKRKTKRGGGNLAVDVDDSKKVIHLPEEKRPRRSIWNDLWGVSPLICRKEFQKKLQDFPYDKKLYSRCKWTMPREYRRTAQPERNRWAGPDDLKYTKNGYLKNSYPTKGHFDWVKRRISSKSRKRHANSRRKSISERPHLREIYDQYTKTWDSDFEWLRKKRNDLSDSALKSNSVDRDVLEHILASMNNQVRSKIALR